MTIPSTSSHMTRFAMPFMAAARAAAMQAANQADPCGETPLPRSNRLPTSLELNRETEPEGDFVFKAGLSILFVEKNLP